VGGKHRLFLLILPPLALQLLSLVGPEARSIPLAGKFCVLCVFLVFLYCGKLVVGVGGVGWGGGGLGQTNQNKTKQTVFGFLGGFTISPLSSHPYLGVRSLPAGRGIFP